MGQSHFSRFQILGQTCTCPADITGQSRALTQPVLVVTFPLGPLLYKYGPNVWCTHSSVIIVVLEIFFNEVFRGTIMLVWFRKSNAKHLKAVEKHPNVMYVGFCGL